ncbi:MAG: hypothetical protein HY905_04960 [Deltaproteobacteria bacterium]|nr:hypothetical protein [Deltaproteobacteria bacterium]
MHRVVAVGLIVVVLALALVVVRVWFASRAEWQAGEALVAEYNRTAAAPGADPAPEERRRRAALLRDAVLRFRAAALWYLPGNPYGRRSLERLLVIGQRAEQAADDRLAVYAYRAARSAVLGTRGFGLGDEETLGRANAAIARVSARLERPPAPGEEVLSGTERERRHLALLRAPEDPNPWFALLATAGLLGWVGGVIGFALRGLDDQCKLRLAPALWAGGVVVCGLAAWAAGLALA